MLFMHLIKLSNPKSLSHENIEITRNIFYYKNQDADLFYVNGKRSLPRVSDNNVFWNPFGCICMSPVIWGIDQVAYFKDWQALGLDKHSIIQDPLFQDIDHDDYTLKTESPALILGFNEIATKQLME